MINKLINKRDNSINKRLLFDTINLNKLTLLCGANGSGKTTFIKCFLENKISSMDKTENIKHLIYNYSNSKNNYRFVGDVNSSFRYKDCFEPYNVLKKMNSGLLSEGQAMIYSIKDFLYTIDNLPKEDGINYLILIDEFDSGLSINMINRVLERITLLNKREDFQFIISFNNYQVAKCFPNNIVSMYDGNPIHFNDYAQFEKFICDNKYLELISKNAEIDIDD